MTDKAETEFDLEQWPDELIRAVATAEPALLRTGDVFAVKGREGLLRYASSLAENFLEKEDFVFVDMEGYATTLGESEFFRLFELEGEQWYVATWKGRSEAVPDSATPIAYKSVGQKEWSDELVRAVAAQAPELLFTRDGDSWAIHDSEFEMFARYMLFEGHCDETLYRHVDIPCYVEYLKNDYRENDSCRHSGFKKVTAEGGEVWYVDYLNPTLEPECKPDFDAKELGLPYGWPEALVVAVAAEYPEIFRTREYESVTAISEENLDSVLSEWADGCEEEVSKAGGLASWKASLIAKEFVSVEIDAERWWIYRPAPTTHAANAES